jgi:hypothetical protein
MYPSLHNAAKTHFGTWRKARWESRWPDRRAGEKGLLQSHIVHRLMPDVFRENGYQGRMRMIELLLRSGNRGGGRLSGAGISGGCKDHGHYQGEGSG